MHTFDVSQVECASLKLPQTTLHASLEKRTHRRLEAARSNLDGFVESSEHAVLEAIHMAFAEHLPLTLSPDDVWLCLAQGFGHHVRLHAEALRGRFVQHDGEANLIVRRDDFVMGASNNDWASVFDEFSDQIALHLGKKRDLVVANLSTTGPVERTATQIVLMGATQSYFEYIFETLCGIPSITLLGTVEDWKQIRRRADTLAEFGLERWVAALTPILEQFTLAAEGKVDAPFWRSLYRVNEQSGGPYISGWINALFPYINERYLSSTNDIMTRLVPNHFFEGWEENVGRRYPIGPKLSEFPSALSCSPLKWLYRSREIELECLAGFAGVCQNAETFAVRPAIGWAIAEKAGATSRST